MSKRDKLIALMNDPAATPGERQAASRALKRMTETAIEPASGIRNDAIVLQPIAMVTPTEACIYAPSRIQQPRTIERRQLADYNSTIVLMSFEPDGKSNPRQMTAYGFGWDCWYLAVMP